MDAHQGVLGGKTGFSFFLYFTSQRAYMIDSPCPFAVIHPLHLSQGSIFLIFDTHMPHIPHIQGSGWKPITMQNQSYLVLGLSMNSAKISDRPWGPPEVCKYRRQVASFACLDDAILVRLQPFVVLTKPRET